MTNVEIIGLYVGLNLLLAVILMIRVGPARIKEKVSLGDGGNSLVIARMRAHANFVESAPFVLIGLMALANLGASAMALHIFGGAYTFGRVAHAHGMAQENATGVGRTIGALLTALVLLGIALKLLYKVLIA